MEMDSAKKGHEQTSHRLEHARSRCGTRMKLLRQAESQSPNTEMDLGEVCWRVWRTVPQETRRPRMGIAKDGCQVGETNRHRVTTLNRGTRR